MPNWCWNELTVSGDDKEVDRFVEFAKDKIEVGLNILPNGERVIKYEETVLSFETFIPLPVCGWDYNWCCKNWGTKWNCNEVEFYNGIYSFNTAWSPPAPVIKRMGELFPKLTFHLYYEESGDDYEGDYIVEGNNIEDNCRKYTKECNLCNTKSGEVEYHEEVEMNLCPICKKKGKV